MDELSTLLKEHLAGLLAPGETPLAIMATEMTPEGRFAEGFIAATPQRIISASRRNGHVSLNAEVSTSQVVSLERVEAHTVCRIDAHTAEKAVVLGLVTKPASHRIDRVAEALAPFMVPRPQTTGEVAKDKKNGRKHGGWGGHGGEGGQGGADKDRACPKCGKVFPHRLGFCPDCIDRRQIMLRLLAMAKPYAWPMAGSLLMMLFITGIEMTSPLLTKILIDDVIPHANYHLFGMVIGGIVAIYVFSSLFSGSRGMLMAWLGERIVHDLRVDTYAHIQKLSIDFYDERQTGWIMDRVSADTANLQNFLSEGFQDFIRDVMTIVVILGIMFAMSWKLALLTLIPAPFVFWLTLRFMRGVHRLFHSQWRKRAWMTAQLANVIPGIRVVKAFAQEEVETARFTERSRVFMDASVKAGQAFAKFSPVTNFIISIGSILVWAVGGYLVISGKSVTLGTLIAFINYLWRFYGPVGNLSRFSQRLERASTSAQRLFDVLDTEPSVLDATNANDLPQLSGAVTFREVTFGYNPDEPVIKDFSFEVKPGEMIGLVGPSGAGKSTLINLLCRFYDADQGSVEVDGLDVRSVTMDSLHKQIGVVLQEPFLFHGTIAENIAYGQPDATYEKIMQAALAANAHDFIMNLPDGYDTLAGERGQRLSGGERQRISIARAILKNPRILILDEATSSVDTETEAAIQQALERLVQGRTTFAIAHRFSTLRNADRLIVLDEGRLAESGTHEELLAKEDGLFKRLVDIQTQTSQVVAVGG
jgi:ATP-binding cassette subfamily B protein